MKKGVRRGEQERLVVRFWGVRGSFPVSGEGFLHFGGNTSCVEIRAGGRLIVCDMGTGIIRLGNELLRDDLATAPREHGPADGLEVIILVTHAHHDHTQGFPFFKPAYLDTTRLYIYGPRMFNEDFRAIMARSMMAPHFPVDLVDMRSSQTIRNVEESELILARPGKPPEPVNVHRNELRLDPRTVVIRTLKNYAHPKGGVINYRVDYGGRSVVYATDVEGYVGGDARLVNFSKGADLLIHDAQYRPEEYTGLPVPTQGFGHSTFEMAAVVAKAAGVGRLALFHHDPSHDDEEVREIEKQTVRLFPASFAAFEGMEVVL